MRSRLWLGRFSGVLIQKRTAENKVALSRHETIQVIRAPEVGQQLEACTFIAEDKDRDIALFHINDPRSNACVKLHSAAAAIGSPCGSVGFPLAFIDPNTGLFSLVERFQSARVSAYHRQPHPCGRTFAYYETDRVMYRGSSGCPGFLSNAEVFALHNASVLDSPLQKPQENARLAISIWTPVDDIAQLAQQNGISL
jgi:hypothetical protein